MYTNSLILCFYISKPLQNTVDDGADGSHLLRLHATDIILVVPYLKSCLYGGFSKKIQSYVSTGPQLPIQKWQLASRMPFRHLSVHQWGASASSPGLWTPHCTNLFPTPSSSITLANGWTALKWPQWEYWHYGNGQTQQIVGGFVFVFWKVGWLSIIYHMPLDIII